MDKTKLCSKCKKIKPISEFSKRRANRDGLDGRCKECCKCELTKYNKSCKYCDKQYKSTDKNSKYCSKRCSGLDRVERIEVRCSHCGAIMKLIPSRVRKNNFCDVECKGKYFSENRVGENHHRYNSKVVQCSICGKDLVRANCKVKEGSVFYCGDKCKSVGNTGENHPRWNDELTHTDRITERKYPKYYKWREEVFKKDDFTCQRCGDNKGGNLHAHHILNYAEHTKLRTVVSNGITLCNICHKKFHDIYGYTNNNNNQIKKFINKHKIQTASSM